MYKQQKLLLKRVTSVVFYKFLHILYTQLRRIMLITQVLPRLLAPVFAMTSPHTYYHYFCMRIGFTATIAFVTPANSIGHTFVHCLIFFTAAIR